MCYRQAFLIAILSVLLISDAGALGLGSIQVFSALNEPFAAEIELLDIQPDELDTVKVSLAGESELRKIDVEPHHLLRGLRFKPDISQRGRPIIAIGSSASVREPYVDFVLEVNWPKGRLLKEYAVHLDLPAN